MPMKSGLAPRTLRPPRSGALSPTCRWRRRPIGYAATITNNWLRSWPTMFRTTTRSRFNRRCPARCRIWRTPRKRVGHCAEQHGGFRTPALHNHWHGQARRTGAQLRLRCRSHLRGGADSRDHVATAAGQGRFEDRHAHAEDLPVGDARCDGARTVADRWGIEARRQGRSAGAPSGLA